MTFDEIINISPYSLNKTEKEVLLTQRLTELTEFHKNNCKEYKNILKAIDYKKERISSFKQLPYLPVRLFKEMSLKSVPQEEVVKTMTSSGTSGQKVSKIFLNRDTSSNQQKTMVKIVSEFTGSSRMPMIIIDCPSVIKDRNMFSARGAGILGFSIFGAKKIYALNDDMQLNLSGLKDFINENKGKKILLFGFTFMVWQHFYKELLRLKNESGETIDLSNAVLIHGGGWKKLISEAVSPQEFHNCLNEVCGIEKIHDYYGMVEQTGCIYMQCECGHLHASIFSDVIIRRPKDFSEAAIGERGIIQVVSTIPESYPGHSLLTEDEGRILGEDDCPCGRKGKYFEIFGRLKNAEIRGCSDTYAQDHSLKNYIDDKKNVDTIIDKVQLNIGSFDLLKKIQTVLPLKPFCDKVVDFCNDLSKELMSMPEARAFSDIMTLGFWLRKANIKTLQKRFAAGEKVLIGRGIAFHIAPSNVPINYAYSLFSGLICGNANVVRIPSKDFPQVGLVNKAMDKVLMAYPEIKSYIYLVRYDRNKEINDYFSSLCDVRVIWGGDTTISELRKSPIGPRALDITFADRYSLAVIDSDEYMQYENKGKVASDFYNDTYLSDQNACTSPRVVIWTGSRKNEAKSIFWENLYTLVDSKYTFQSIMGVDKISQSYVVAGTKDVKILSHKDNLLLRVEVSKLDKDLMNFRGNCGYFYEYDCNDITELKDLCNDTHCQTIGVLGKSTLLKPLIDLGIKGVDRVVPVGHTMDFDFEWDGYNLVDRLTRTIVIK